MQVVIDIQEESFNDVKKHINFNWSSFSNIHNAFQNAIVLPKGHGRLIDSAELLEKVDEYIKELKELHDWGRVLGVEGVRSIINHAPTVLGADTETATN